MNCYRLKIIRPLRFSISMLFILSLLLAACSAPTSEATREISINEVQVTVSAPTKEPYVFKTSEPNTITVHGTLIVMDPLTMVPAPGDSIFLVPIPADQPLSMVPQFEAGTVPQADVDERVGEFVFTNIEPGQYAVVSVTRGGAQIPVRYYETKTYAIFTLDDNQKDKTFELGKLTLP